MTKTPVFLTVAVVLSRLPFTSRFLFNMDSVQFALGTEDYDVTLHQPHPPGYFLYVMMGRLARHLTGDPNTAFVAISIMFSALAVLAVYYLAKDMFGEDTAVASSLIAATSPLFWFHGEVALSYMPEAFMSAFFAFLCYRMIRGEPGLYPYAALTLAVAGGIRQNTAVFLMPLWLYSMRGLGVRRAFYVGAIFMVASFLWLIPMLYASGGYARYAEALQVQVADAVWHGIGIAQTAFNARYIFSFIISSLGAAIAPMLAFIYFAVRGHARLDLDGGKAVFFILWLMPSLLFFLVVYTQPGAPGYALIYAVGLYIIAGRSLVAVSEMVSRAGHGRAVRIPFAAGLAFVCAVNALAFSLIPYPISARGIKEHDRELSAYIRVIRAGFSPSDTEIIGIDRFLFGYRHAMYYLPEYRSYNSVVMHTPEGRRLFWSVGRKTFVSDRIELLPTTRHIIDFLDCDQADISALPEGARISPVMDGRFLVHYEGRDDLYRVKRLAPLLGPPGEGG